MTITMPRLDRLPAQERGLTIGDFLVPIRVSERMNARLRHIALILIGTTLIALCARISFLVPGNPVPFTGQTFGVLLSAGALGFRRGLAASLLYLAIGAIGLPVFAGGAQGVGEILGASGGYLIGFVVASALVGRLAELGWDRTIFGAIGAMLLGSLVIYAVGVPWLAVTAFGGDLALAFEKGMRTFLLWDAVKLLLAAAAFPAAWWFVGRRPGDR
ncbi:MAG: biotin transport system substrate-specific component [Chloroflexota bacterium]|jgi:biotin transport system substrate-specific component|nr:biotin transport system substrate-specific component [Chloroflexota bacterium]